VSVSSSLVWALPDLTLIACPKPVDRYDSSFYDEYWRVLIEDHVPKCREYGFAVLLSDEIVIWLQEHFPFTEVGLGSWIDDFQIVFFAFLEEIRKEWPEPTQIGMPDNPVLIDPDIIPPFVAPELRDAWLDLLAWCIEQPSGETYVASIQGLYAPATSVDALDMNNAPLCSIELVPQALSWKAVLARLDPWAAARLPKPPKPGGVAYKPREPYRSGERFPWDSERKGYVDEHGCVWVWDYMERHWDVQDARSGYGRYRRITEDGSTLP